MPNFIMSVINLPAKSRKSLKALSNFRLSFLLPLCFLAFPLLVSAHFEAVDQDMRVTMHIDPLDRPAVGAPATFSFDFTDNLHQFRPQFCDCAMTVYQNNQFLYSARLFEPTPPVYTFGQAGDYTVTLVGKPKIDGEFEPFSVTFPLPVAEQLSWVQQIWNFFANLVAKISQH